MTPVHDDCKINSERSEEQKRINLKLMNKQVVILQPFISWRSVHITTYKCHSNSYIVLYKPDASELFHTTNL